MAKVFLENQEFAIEETHKTLITVIIYNGNIPDIIGKLYKQLEKIKNIKHPKTKKLLNDRLYNFIQLLETLPQERVINNLYLMILPYWL